MCAPRRWSGSNLVSIRLWCARWRRRAGGTAAGHAPGAVHGVGSRLDRGGERGIGARASREHPPLVSDQDILIDGFTGPPTLRPCH
jgi:hypothetical protein